MKQILNNIKGGIIRYIDKSSFSVLFTTPSILSRSKSLILTIFSNSTLFSEHFRDAFKKRVALIKKISYNKQ